MAVGARMSRKRRVGDLLASARGGCVWPSVAAIGWRVVWLATFDGGAHGTGGVEWRRTSDVWAGGGFGGERQLVVRVVRAGDDRGQAGRARSYQLAAFSAWQQVRPSRVRRNMCIEGTHNATTEIGANSLSAQILCDCNCVRTSRVSAARSCCRLSHRCTRAVRLASSGALCAVDQSLRLGSMVSIQ